MKFRFRLDPVLGERERVERERAGDHARVLALQLAAERDRDDLITKRHEGRELLVREHATLDADILRATYVHLEYLDRAITTAHERVAACEADTRRALARLVAASQDRKVLETLRERRKESFDLDAAYAEQRELDDQNARVFERAHTAEGQAGL